MAEKKTKYSQIIENIFTDFYKKGMTEVPFSREHISEYAERLGIKTPKNLGDVVYSFRYRASLPQKIQDTAPDGKEWLIVGTGSANYCFRLSNIVNIFIYLFQETLIAMVVRFTDPLLTILIMAKNYTIHAIKQKKRGGSPQCHLVKTLADRPPLFSLANKNIKRPSFRAHQRLFDLFHTHELYPRQIR